MGIWRLFSFLALLRSAEALPPLASGPWGPRQPIAPESNVVTVGRARFTVLSDRLLRLEYNSAEGSLFEDRATMFAINRNFETLATFSQTSDEDFLYIETSALSLTYALNQPFNSTR